MNPRRILRASFAALLVDVVCCATLACGKSPSAPPPAVATPAS